MLKPSSVPRLSPFSLNGQNLLVIRNKYVLLHPVAIVWVVKEWESNKFLSQQSVFIYYMQIKQS